MPERTPRMTTIRVSVLRADDDPGLHARASRDPGAAASGRRLLSMLPGSEELAPGLHRWVAYHEEWKHEVASVAVQARERLVLIDPLAPSGVREARQFWKALDVEARARAGVDVIVTLYYHRRSAAAVVERYGKRPGAALWAPHGSLAKLHVEADHAFAAGDTLAGGIVGYRSGLDYEAVLWLPEQKALVTGDVLLGGARKPYRVCPQSWLPKGIRRADVAAALEPLLDLPVALLVPTHGPAVTEAAAEALEAAVAEARGR